MLGSPLSKTDSSHCNLGARSSLANLSDVGFKSLTRITNSLHSATNSYLFGSNANSVLHSRNVAASPPSSSSKRIPDSIIFDSASAALLNSKNRACHIDALASIAPYYTNLEIRNRLGKQVDNNMIRDARARHPSDLFRKPVKRYRQKTTDNQILHFLQFVLQSDQSLFTSWTSVGSRQLKFSSTTSVPILDPVLRKSVFVCFCVFAYLTFLMLPFSSLVRSKSETADVYLATCSRNCPSFKPLRKTTLLQILHIFAPHRLHSTTCVDASKSAGLTLFRPARFA